MGQNITFLCFAFNRRCWFAYCSCLTISLLFDLLFKVCEQVNCPSSRTREKKRAIIAQKKNWTTPWKEESHLLQDIYISIILPCVQNTLNINLKFIKKWRFYKREKISSKISGKNLSSGWVVNIPVLKFVVVVKKQNSKRNRESWRG